MTTTLDVTRYPASTPLSRPVSAGTSPRRGPSIVAVALAAAVAGGALGIGGAIATSDLRHDPVAEHARLTAFADQLRRAFAIDDLWQQQHPVRP